MNIFATYIKYKQTKNIFHEPCKEILLNAFIQILEYKKVQTYDIEKFRKSKINVKVLLKENYKQVQN